MDADALVGDARLGRGCDAGRSAIGRRAAAGAPAQVGGARAEPEPQQRQRRRRRPAWPRGAGLPPVATDRLRPLRRGVPVPGGEHVAPARPQVGPRSQRGRAGAARGAHAAQAAAAPEHHLGARRLRRRAGAALPGDGVRRRRRPRVAHRQGARRGHAARGRRGAARLRAGGARAAALPPARGAAPRREAGQRLPHARGHRAPRRLWHRQGLQVRLGPRVGLQVCHRRHAALHGARSYEPLLERGVRACRALPIKPPPPSGLDGPSRSAPARGLRRRPRS